MLVDGLNLIDGVITNAHIEQVTAFPTTLLTPGRMVYLTTTVGANLPGLYVTDGTSSFVSAAGTSSAVTSVAGRTGAVVLSVGDVSGAGDFKSSGSVNMTGPLIHTQGTVAAPSIVLLGAQGQVNTGIFGNGNNDISFAIAGVTVAEMISSQFIVGAGTSLYAQKNVYTALGTAAAPTFAFAQDNTTGLYGSGAGAGILNITTSGVNRVSISTTAITSTLPITTPTPTTADNSTTVATTAFVKAQGYTTAAAAAAAAVTSFNTRTGAVTLSSADVTGALTFTPASQATVGVASGIASLDGAGKLPAAQIPLSLVGAMQYQGTWNPSTNTPALASGVGTKGQFYKVSTAATNVSTIRGAATVVNNGGGTNVTSVQLLSTSAFIVVGDIITINSTSATITALNTPSANYETFTPAMTFSNGDSAVVKQSAPLDGITQFNVGDIVAFNGTTWDKIDGIASEVVSVAGRTGAVVLTAADISGIVTSVAGRTGAVVLTAADVSGVATSGANSNITSLTGLTTALSVLQGGTGVTTSTGTGSGAHAVSPAFTGTPTAPTPATADSSTTLATTAFVKAQGYGVAGVAGADTQIQYNNAGVFGASANFTYAASSTLTLTNPAAATDKVIITPTSITISTATASFRSDQQRDLTVNAGDVSTANAAGLLTVRGADSAQLRAGSVIVRGGNNNTGSAGGGDITLAGGAGGSGIPGFVYMKTANTERFRIDNVGTVTATTNNLVISSPAGSYRTLYWFSGTSGRWNMHADTTTEGGSDSGSNFNMIAQGDTGTQTTVYSINRASKILDFKISPTSVTPATADSSTTLATTAFVKAQGYVSSTGATLTGATLTGATLTGNTSIQAIFEKVSAVSAAPAAVQNIDLNTAGIWNFTVAATANFTMNVRGSSTASLDSTMTIGQSASVAVLVLNGAAAFYPTSFTIDGAVVTPKWNGTAPTAGDASAIDSYSLTIIKTAAATFTVLATVTKFA